MEKLYCGLKSSDWRVISGITKISIIQLSNTITECPQYVQSTVQGFSWWYFPLFVGYQQIYAQNPGPFAMIKFRHPINYGPS